MDPSDLALGAGGRTLYVASGPGAVIPVRTATLRRGRPIPFGDDGPQLVMGPGGRALYVLGSNGLVSRIVTRTGRVAWSVATTSEPAAMGLTPDGRRLYVLADAPPPARGYLIQFNAATGAIVRGITVGRDPLAIAFGPAGRTAYVLCSPTWLQGHQLKFGIGSVVPVTVATGKAGQPVLTGRGSLSLAVVPGKSYEPWEAGPEK
jgi:DNA-binding beta-propeller fold protein YncE